MTIKEYSNLIGPEPFLAITWEPDFSQACSFCRMLMNHKIFHSTQIPEKTDYMIFLKKPPVFGSFLTIFGQFCLIGIFSKNSGSVTYNYIWAPNRMLSFRKKLISQFWENLQTDRRTDRKTDWITDRRTDGRTHKRTDRRMDIPYFKGSFQQRLGVKHFAMIWAYSKGASRLHCARIA